MKQSLFTAIGLMTLALTVTSTAHAQSYLRSQEESTTVTYEQTEEVERGRDRNASCISCGSLAAEIADDAMEIVHKLKPYATDYQEVTYLTPIKKSAGWLYANAVTRSPYSPPVRHALLRLEAEIQAAGSFISDEMETDRLSDLAIDLLTVEQKIEAITN